MSVGVCGIESFQLVMVKGKEIFVRREKELQFIGNNLTNIRNGLRLGVGRWFDENIWREVGDNNSNLFWWDPWSAGVTLKDRFTHHFEYKMATMADMQLLSWGKGLRLGSGVGD